MKKIIFKLFLLLLSIAIEIYMRVYFVVILLILILLLSLFQSNRSAYLENLCRLQIINQISTNMDEKLSICYGKTNLPFDEYCAHLKVKAKNKEEKVFFEQLNLCKTKAQIDNLLLVKMSDFFDNTVFFLNNFLVHVYFFIINLFLPYFTSNINLNFTFIVINICLVLGVMIRNSHEVVTSKFNRQFYKFYLNLSYLRPMEALKSVIDDKHKNVFNYLYEDVKNKKLTNKNISDPHKIIISQIYKVCFNNNYRNNQILSSYFEKIMNCNIKKVLEILPYIIILLSLILEIIL